MATLRKDLVTYLPQLRRYAEVLTANASDADDIVQECLVRTLDKVNAWSEVRNPRAYLFSILHNVFVDKVNHARPETTNVEPDAINPRQRTAQTPIQRLALYDLDKALQALPSNQREVVLLAGIEGMPYREIAEILDIPMGTVMSRLSRGRKTLRTLLDGHTYLPLDAAE